MRLEVRVGDDTPIAIRGKKGNWTCPRHPDSYDMNCGLCDIASHIERGRLKVESNIHKLAFTYLKDGMTPEDAEAKARENYCRLTSIIYK